MKKRALSILMSLTMATTALVGCGSTATEAATEQTQTEDEAAAKPAESTEKAESTDAAQTESSDPVTVKFWNSFTGSDGDKLVELVNKFNEENEYNITVEMDISSNLDEQLSSAFAAGEGPALLLFSSASRFTYGDYMQSMNDIFDVTSLDKSDFIESYVDYCSEDGETYLIPFQIVSFYLYWNKDLFKAAGLDPEKGPETWDEYIEYSKAITDASKNIYGSGLCYGYNYQMAHVIQRFGDLAVTKDDSGKYKANFAGNAGYAKFLDMYKGLVDSGDNPLTDDTDSMMTAGQLGMTINGPWLSAGMDTAGVNYGITTIPTGDAGAMNSVEVLGFAVTTVATEEEKLAAYRFIEWWNTADAEGNSPALTWSLENGCPAYLKSVIDSDKYQANAKVMSMTNKDTSVKSDFITSSVFPGATQIINDIIPQVTQPVLFDNKASEDVLNDAQTLADEIVKSYN